jgi:hypothetical protein
VSHRAPFSFNAPFAPRTGVNLGVILLGVTVTSSFAVSTLLWTGISLANGDVAGLPGALLLGAFSTIFAFPFILTFLAVLGIPLTLILKRAKVTWQTAILAGIGSAAVAGGLFGLAMPSPEWLWMGAGYGAGTAALWLFALHRFAAPVQSADMDGVIADAA